LKDLGLVILAAALNSTILKIIYIYTRYSDINTLPKKIDPRTL